MEPGEFSKESAERMLHNLAVQLRELVDMTSDTRGMLTDHITFVRLEKGDSTFTRERYFKAGTASVDDIGKQLFAEFNILQAQSRAFHPIRYCLTWFVFDSLDIQVDIRTECKRPEDRNAFVAYLHAQERIRSM